MTTTEARPSTDLVDGTLVARGPNGERRIPASEFFTGYFESALAPDEMLVEVELPATPGACTTARCCSPVPEGSPAGCCAARPAIGVKRQRNASRRLFRAFAGRWMRAGEGSVRLDS